jgi:hypothetical protein
MEAAMPLRPSLLCGIALVTAVMGSAFARDIEMGGDNDYPNSIMAPEPGTARHHRGAGAAATPSHHASLLGREKFVGKLHRRPGVFTARGSSGLVLPTPLPRTPLISPEGGGVPLTRTLPQEQGSTVVPGLTNPIPNLPHGTETFQDRASRCAAQAGLYGVPNGSANVYMHSCAM